MKKNLSVSLIALGIFTATPALAERAYIVDQLLVGLHQKKDVDSPIIKVLSTGTEVDIISREGDFAEIREMAENKIGWVDSSYLMLDKPAKIQLQQLQEKIKELESQQTVQGSQALKAENEEKVSELEKQMEELQQNLSSEKLKVGDLEATISKNEKKLAQIEANGDDVRVAELEAENSELLSKLESASQGSSTTNNAPELLQSIEPFKSRPVQIALGVLALVAFIFGRRWEDRKSRRRHGGFRV